MSKKQLTFIAAVVVAALAVGGVAAAKSTSSSGGSLKGAGSTFVLPLVSQWQANYKGASVSYSAIGSGGGIKAVQNRSVDFGASDAPMTPDDAKLCNGCTTIPWAVSATSIPYHVPGISYGLKLTGQILAGIYLGHITKWNDPSIKKLNPGVSLPDLKITPVFRSDPSGTSYNFTDFLSSVSKQFKSKIGVTTTPNFTTGIGARGSGGLAGVVSRTDGAIGYVDVAYSLRNGFKFAKVQNRAGKFQLPGLRGIAAAVASVKRVPSSGIISIVNPSKKHTAAYPICTFTYVIVPTKSSKASTLKQFISWAITSGQQYGPPLKFLPLPKVVRLGDHKLVQRIHS